MEEAATRYAVLNVHMSTGKINYGKYSFHEELECISDKFPKYYTKILLRDFNAKIGREDIFKPTNGNDNLLEINNNNNNNGVRVINFAISKNIAVKSTLLPHCNIHTFTWTSDVKTRNQTDNILIDCS
jgi:hypothetical protein